MAIITDKYLSSVKIKIGFIKKIAYGNRSKKPWTRANVVQKYKKSRKIKRTLILQLFLFSISIKVKGISYIKF
jgi:hypothetical protein